MARSIFRSFGKIFLSFLSAPVLAAGLVCFSLSAFAAPQQGQGPNVVAGCNPAVWNALTAKAEAQVAYDVAVTRQMINEPDSVLNLTCFDEAAGVSGAVNGLIFSGPFATQLSLVMPVAGLNGDVGTTDNPKTLGVYNCTAIANDWNQIATEGINTGAPYITFEQLMAGTPFQKAQNDFETGWNAAASQGIFSNLNNMVTALPQPPSSSQSSSSQGSSMDFSSAKSSCDVLKIANILQGDCPAVGGQGPAQ